MSNDDGVFLVRCEHTVAGRDRPSVIQVDRSCRGCCDHRFDGENEPFGEDVLLPSVLKIRDLGILVNRPADTVPAQLADHLKSVMKPLRF